MAKKYQLKVESAETVSLEPVEAEIEAVETPSEAFEPAGKVITHTVGVNDTWAVLGAKYKPQGKTGFEHAVYLQKLNNGASLRPGMVVKL